MTDHPLDSLAIQPARQPHLTLKGTPRGSCFGRWTALNLTELRDKARYIRVTSAGQRESAPHDIIEVKATK